METPASLFEEQMPPSVAPLTFLGGDNLTEICSKSVRRLQTELHHYMPGMPVILIFKLKECQ